MIFFAHSPDTEIPHDPSLAPLEFVKRHSQTYESHILGVVELARAYAKVFGAEHEAALVALLHDAGKTAKEWQDRLIENALEEYHKGKMVPRKRIGFNHTEAGALLLLREIVAGNLPGHWRYLINSILNHHGWLNSEDAAFNLLVGWSLPTEKDTAQVTRIEDAISKAIPADSALDAVYREIQEASSESRGLSNLEVALRLRMVHSCLLDADNWDTSRFYSPHECRVKQPVPWEVLRDQLAEHVGSKPTSGAHDASRRFLYQTCTEAGIASPAGGVYSLTAPTGSGKTLAGLSFALEHAAKHNLERVIVVIPYCALGEQTAAVYRGIFGDDVVLEHHSNVVQTKEEAKKRRKVTQNWDAQIIVTTTVQFFESLFTVRNSRLRKIHRIAKSIVVWDETQVFPLELLQPTWVRLKQLVDQYQTTLLMTSATMPVPEKGIEALGAVTEINDNIHALFSAFQCVDYELRLDVRTSWADLASELMTEPQALVIVNTVKDSYKLLDAVAAAGRMGEEVYYLSSRCYPRHRSDTISSIKSRLLQGLPCLVISTQLVEAGMDLDFPVVFRALGPLDRIAQAAGRCNREGRLERGRVVIFDPQDGSLPPGQYQRWSSKARDYLLDSTKDLKNPQTFQHYFGTLYHNENADAHKILQSERSGDYDITSNRYRVIREAKQDLVVCRECDAAEVLQLVTEFSNSRYPASVVKSLQPFVVSLFPKQFTALKDATQVREVQSMNETASSIFVLDVGTLYHEQRGLDLGGVGVEDFV